MKQWFIGWDTGAWYTKSKEAFWILDEEGKTEGHAAFNLRDAMCECPDLKLLLNAVGEKCGISGLCSGKVHVTIAIDAPFGFPTGFRQLLADGTCEIARRTGPSPEKAIDSPYLYRATERFVAKNSESAKAPLSALQDSIGSQTTKAIHFLKRYGFTQTEDGVWSKEFGDEQFEATAIEVYPATCKRLKEEAKAERKDGEKRRTADDYEVFGPLDLNREFGEMLEEHPKVTLDERDAFICAHLARVFSEKKASLYSPGDFTGDWNREEGWIWFPKIKEV